MKVTQLLFWNVSALFCIVAAFVSSASAQIQTANVTGGQIKGVVDSDLSIFKGIPFAAPLSVNCAGKRRSR
jgi:hypothetical protein